MATPTSAFLVSGMRIFRSNLILRSIIASALSVCSINVHAAVRYRFKSSMVSSLTFNSRGSVVIDGSKSRVEFEILPDEVVPHDVEISVGSRRLGVDRVRKSWYELKPRTASFMFSIPAGNVTKVSDVSVKLTGEQPGAPSSPLRRYTLRFSYRVVGDIEGTKVKANIIGVAKFLSDSSWPAESLPLDPREIRTNLAQVDEAIAREMRLVSGLPLEAELVITRQIEGGAAFTETRHTKISDIEEVAAHPSLFEVPRGYENREPEYGVP